MPSGHIAFRQVDEKHVSVEVEEMLWSPKFDLVALSNVQGEVVLHRLSWQKVWVMPAPSENVKVKAMAWRSDGKVLAVGYSTGHVNLCYIENAEILHKFEVKGEITCMTWIAEMSPENMNSTSYPEDCTETYLARLQPLNKSYGTLSKGNIEEVVEDGKKLKDQKELNLLLIGHNQQEIHVYAYGIFPVARITIADHNGFELKKMCSAMLSYDLSCLVVFVEMLKEEDQVLEFAVVKLHTALLASRHKELRLLALKYGHIATLFQYLNSTIQQMSEAWEDILMEMDSKLMKFAEEKKKSGEGTVSNDFLELLLFGTPSTELQAFLLHELTDKGLKKLGHSIETSYSNIQKLVVKHLQSVAQAILYHLSELKGMSMWYEKFGVLGLDPSRIQAAVMIAGSFVLKTSELQQVIDGSIKNFKAFFRWLYVVILRLSDEKPPSELSKMTQHDINFVSEFLKDNFTHFSAEEEEEDNIAFLHKDKKPGFKMEKVGQYLKKEDLSYPPEVSGNPWIQYLQGSLHVKESTLLYPTERNKSLVQLQEKLEEAVNNVLMKPSITIGKSVKVVSSLYLFFERDSLVHSFVDIPRITQFSIRAQSQLYTVFTSKSLPCEKFFIIRQQTDPSRFGEPVEVTSVTIGGLGPKDPNDSMTSIEERCEKHHILDVTFYDEKTLSLLLVEKTGDEVPILLQVPLAFIKDDQYQKLTANERINLSTTLPVFDIGSLIEPQHFRRLENMKAHSFAVSGTRHTATVLFSSRRRVRIFLMDAEEEDDEEDEEEEQSSNSDADNSQSASLMVIDQISENIEDKENASFVI
ncbi:hypothetical protein CHS0354_014065 [Potamilus streckersoni]|uniref:Anaphase-promoting complex subunit 4 n=1 Tax=Potamilus streckersoni TaxID=2493646 RepID=A0AAE0SV10_9BIVA|nr:hypothetical protein CHS0354_014065 [Potamilus streckersoni]